MSSEKVSDIFFKLIKDFKERDKSFFIHSHLQAQLRNDFSIKLFIEPGCDKIKFSKLYLSKIKIDQNFSIKRCSNRDKEYEECVQ
jgi:hypothetical protein